MLNININMCICLHKYIDYMLKIGACVFTSRFQHMQLEVSVTTN